MKRLVGLFVLIMVMAAAIVVALRGRSHPVPHHGAPLDPKILPIAPDMDSIPSDSTWFGELVKERKGAAEFFRGPDSPLEDTDRKTFAGLDYWSPDPSLRLRLPLERFPHPDSVVILDTKGEERVFQRTGRFRFSVSGQEQALTLYRQTYHNYWFLPFRDTTAGTETYEVGRYVEPVELKNDWFLIDFNRAYNPYCAYSHRWACPIPPEENRMTVPIRAGEKMYHSPAKS